VQTEAKVGIAVIVGALLLVLLLGRVERWTAGEQNGTHIQARFDTVAGLEVKSPVEVAGVQVGEVESIQLAEGQALVSIRLLPGALVYHGSKATIKATGLLGEKYLELTPGDPSQGPIKSGESVPQRAGSADLDRLIANLNDISDDIRAVSKSLQGALGTPEGERNIAEIVANTRDFTAALKDKGPELMDRLNAIFAKIQSGEGTIGRLVNDPKLYDDLEATLVDVKDLMNKVGEGEGTLGKLINDPTLYDRLEKAAGGVEEITRKVSSGEGTLGKLLTDDTTVNNLNKAVESFSELGSRVDRLKTFITFRNEFQTDTSDSKGYFTLRLQPRERRAYIVEVSDDPRGKVSETTLDVTTGGTTTTSTTLKTERRLTLSAMFAQRLAKDFEVYGGLMENTAGVGVGYEAVRHVNLLFDAWDFNSVRPQHDSPHLKATARFRLGDYLFVQGGMDDFLNSDYASPFVGAGLTFEDEDLKYLLGTAASALH